MRMPFSSTICCTMWPSGTCIGIGIGGPLLETILTVAGPTTHTAHTGWGHLNSYRAYNTHSAYRLGPLTQSPGLQHTQRIQAGATYTVTGPTTHTAHTGWGHLNSYRAYNTHSAYRLGPLRQSPGLQHTQRLQAGATEAVTGPTTHTAHTGWGH